MPARHILSALKILTSTISYIWYNELSGWLLSCTTFCNFITWRDAERFNLWKFYLKFFLFWWIGIIFWPWSYLQKNELILPNLLNISYISFVLFTYVKDALLYMRSVSDWPTLSCLALNQVHLYERWK